MSDNTDSPDPRFFIKIFGPFSSGTNLLAWHLLHNFEGVMPLSLLLGWKHGPVLPVDEQGLPEHWFDPTWVERSNNSLVAGATAPAGLLQTLETVTSRQLIKRVLEESAAGTVSTIRIVRNPFTWFGTASYWLREVTIWQTMYSNRWSQMLAW